MDLHHIAILPRSIKSVLASAGISKSQYCEKCGFFEQNNLPCDGVHSLIPYPNDDFESDMNPLYCEHCGEDYERNKDCAFKSIIELSPELTLTHSTRSSDVSQLATDRRNSVTDSSQGSNAPKDKAQILVSQKYYLSDESSQGRGSSGPSMHDNQPPKINEQIKTENSKSWNLLFAPIQLISKPRMGSIMMNWFMRNKYYKQAVNIKWSTIIQDIRSAYPVAEERDDLQFEIGKGFRKCGTDSYIETYTSIIHDEIVPWTADNIDNGVVGTMSNLRLRAGSIKTLVIRIW